MSERRRSWLAVVLLVGLVLARAPGVVSGRAVFWSHDLRHHHLPWRAWAAERWAGGTVPLWSADVGAGFPLAADGQVGVFYPPNLLFGLLFDPYRALSLNLLAHGAWAAIGAWWLCRRLGRSQGASLLAGVAWASSGFLVARLTYGGLYAAASWIPWLIGAAIGLARAPSGRGALGLALAVGAALTAGHPQMAAIGLLGAFVAALAQRPGPRAWAGAAIAGLGGLALAAPQLAASLELAGQSERGGGVDASFAAMGGLPPQEIINLVLPRFWGWEPPARVPLTYIHKSAAYFGTGENHWEDCIFLGFPVMLLAWAGLRRERWALWLAGLGGVLMLGASTPAWPILHQVPGFDFFRFPVRFSGLLSIGLIALAAAGYDRVQQEPETRARLARAAEWLAGGLLVCGVGAYFVLRIVQGKVAEILGHALAQHPDGPARVDAILRGMAFNGSLGLIPPLIALLGFAALSRWRPAGLVALVAVDMAGNLWDYNPTTPLAEATQAPTALPLLPRGPDLDRSTVVDRVQSPALDSELLSASLGLLWGTHDLIVLSPLRLPAHERLLAAAGLDVGMDHGPGKARDVESNLGIVRMLGVRALLTTHALNHPALAEVQAAPVHVYRVPGVAARASVMPCTVEPGVDALATLRREDLASTAVVEGLPAGCVEAHGAAEILSYADEEVRISASGPGFLLLTDTFYPGWEATLDGEAAPLRRANVSLRGVALPSGLHQVVFRYAPWWRALVPVWALSWVLGLVATAVSWFWATGPKKAG